MFNKISLNILKPVVKHEMNGRETHDLSSLEGDAEEDEHDVYIAPNSYSKGNADKKCSNH